MDRRRDRLAFFRCCCESIASIHEPEPQRSSESKPAGLSDTDKKARIATVHFLPKIAPQRRVLRIS